MESIKKPGIIAAISFIVFMGSTSYFIYQSITIREEHLFYSQESSENNFDETILLGANHTYEITVGLRDRDSVAATVSGEVSILLNGTEIVSEELSDYDQGGEDYEPSAWDSIRIDVLNNETANLTIIGTMETGDYWSLKIYEDLPDIGVGSLGIILSVSGYASIFSGVWLACAVLRIAKKKAFSSESDEEDDDEEIRDRDLGVEYYD